VPTSIVTRGPAVAAVEYAWTNVALQLGMHTDACMLHVELLNPDPYNMRAGRRLSHMSACIYMHIVLYIVSNY
jgi:hypothetical protein